MACNSMAIPSTPATIAQKDVFIEHNGLFRSNSAKDLCNRATMQRSYSDNHLCYSINRARAASTQPKLKSSRSVGILPFQIASSIIPTPLRSFLFDPETSKDMNIAKDGVEISSEKGGDIADCSDEGGANDDLGEVKRANWVERVCEIRSHWRNRQQNEDIFGEEPSDASENGVSNCEGGCIVDYDSDEEEGETKYDRETFSRFLAPVAWSDIKLFSKLAFLCNMAYVIPEIKAMDLRRYHGLHFVTSSLEKKAEAAAMKEKLDQDSTHFQAADFVAAKSNPRNTEGPEQKHPIRSSVAYGIAASAASYVQSRAQGLLSHGAQPQHEGECTDSSNTGNQPVEDIDPPAEDGERSQRVYKKSEVAAYVTASTMTAVVAAGEKEKQEAARDLQSLHSAPCEWFVCDDISTYTRCFVIQGSDSLASWQANLLFEPAKFEGSDVLVHRGIYKAAKGIYDQFMPEIMEHLNKYGKRAKLQFTGHSLGGSLSLLVHLMLLTRKVAKPSTLRPVVAFGSPFVFCGGQKILNHLGLDDNHVHCVVMHRDIVPRAFSCNYPNHVALVLKRLRGSFQSHPCLIKNKSLYSPIGKLFILQPDEKSSPPHPLLPPGSALYAFNKTQYGYSASAIKAFLNCPHPLETLSDPKAYGSEGTILRDHDSSNYLKALNKVLRQKLKMVRKVHGQRNQLWPLLASPSPHSWNHENTLEKSVLGTKKVMTGG